MWGRFLGYGEVKVPIQCVGSCLLDSNEVEEWRSLGVTAILSLQTEQDTGERGIE